MWKEERCRGDEGKMEGGWSENSSGYVLKINWHTSMMCRYKAIASERVC
jgi:hypothetical protein